MVHKPIKHSKLTTIKYFLTIFIPIITLAFTLLFFLFNKDKNYQEKHVALDIKNIVNVRNKSINDILNSIITDTLIIARNSEHQIIGKNINIVEGKLLVFSKNKKIYDQIRYINETGKEIIRINFNDGKPAIVQKEKLQNKAKRYYFLDTLKLKKNEIFISPLDLNIENGKIEKPLKPMLRIGTPIFDKHGNKKGIILLNYFANKILNIFSLEKNNILGQISFLNSKGYWLKGNSISQEWGFMYEDKKEISLANKSPNIWKNIIKKDSGQFKYEDALITFTTVYPLLNAKSLSSSTGSGKSFKASSTQIYGKKYFWKIVHIVNPTELKIIFKPNENNMITLFAFLSIIIFIISLIMAIILMKRRTSVKLLIENEKKLKKLLNSSNEEVAIVDINGIIVSSNDAFANSFGKKKEEIINQNAFDFLDTQTSEKRKSVFNKIITLKKPFKWEDEHSGKFYQNSIVPILDDNEEIIEIALFAEDISKLKQSEKNKKFLEAQLMQNQKMEAIGTLAGGIAHDFNNILGIILGYTDLAKENTPENSNFAKYLDKINYAGERAKELVQQILTFSRKTKTERITLDPRPIIKEALKMLRASIPVSIEIKKNISSECGNIDADPTQIYQIIMNLCTNAFHAMEKDGGILSIELQIADTIPIELKNENMIEQTFVKLSVSDTGTGIAPDIIDKIFDPFFTTKEVGEGTGMGLSIIYGIIKEYGGAITVKSTADKGTVFDIYIPQSKQKPTSSTLNKIIIPKGVEQILFIDDEEFIVDMNREMLENLGYKVITSQKSTEALNIFQKEPDKFDIIITDQTMPNITGLELSIQALKIRPDIPIILCTGFSNIINEEKAKAYGIKGFLHKPVAITNLSKLIRELLD